MTGPPGALLARAAALALLSCVVLAGCASLPQREELLGTVGAYPGGTLAPEFDGRTRFREIFCGLTLGVLLSLVGMGRVVLGHELSNAFGTDWSAVALAVGLSLTCVVLWGVVIGSTLPFLLRRIGGDPAASSAPAVATIADVTGLMIYLLVATTILR